MSGYRWNKAVFRVRLSCGCTVKLRDQPYTKSDKFTCSMPLVHGYRTGWVSWENSETGASRVNG